MCRSEPLLGIEPQANNLAHYSLDNQGTQLHYLKYLNVFKIDFDYKQIKKTVVAVPIKLIHKRKYFCGYFLSEDSWQKPGE